MVQLSGEISSIRHLDYRLIRRESGANKLPKYYGDTKIVLMPRDPFRAFAYWELAPKTRDELSRKYTGGRREGLRFALRVYDVTGIIFDGENARRYFDIELNPAADNWYIHIPEPDRTWCVDLCLITPTGNFITIARSNIVSMPSYGVSSVIDEKWLVSKGDFKKLIKWQDTESLGKSSFSIPKIISKGMEEVRYLISITVSSLSLSSYRKEWHGHKK